MGLGNLAGCLASLPLPETVDYYQTTSLVKGELMGQADLDFHSLMEGVFWTVVYDGNRHVDHGGDDDVGDGVLTHGFDGERMEFLAK